MNANAIILKQLSVQRGNMQLCTHINSEISQGSVLHITGENGSGKSTLLLMLAGVLPILAGSAVWHGQPPVHWSSVFIGHKFGMDLRLQAQQNLHYLHQLHPIKKSGKAGTQPDYAAALAAVGLSGYEDVPCRLLSSGQKRRVQLARLWLDVQCLQQPAAQEKKLAAHRLWLLDEPLTALDTSMAEKVQQLIGTFTQLGGRVVLSSHQPLGVHAMQLALPQHSNHAATLSSSQI